MPAPGGIGRRRAGRWCRPRWFSGNGADAACGVRTPRAAAMCDAGGAKYCVGASDSSSSIVASAAIAPGQMIEPPDTSPANARRIPALECNGKAIRHRSERVDPGKLDAIAHRLGTLHCFHGTIFGAPVVPDVCISKAMSSASGASMATLPRVDSATSSGLLPGSPDEPCSAISVTDARRAARTAAESRPSGTISASMRIATSRRTSASSSSAAFKGAHVAVEHDRQHHDREVGPVGQRDSDARAPAEAGAGQAGRDRCRPSVRDRHT